MLNVSFFKDFNSMGHNGFLNNVSITRIDNTDGKNPKKRKNFENLLTLWT